MMKIPEFRKYPPVFTFFPLSAGVLLSYYFNFGISQFEPVYFLAVLLAAVLLALVSYKYVFRIISRAYLLFALITFLFGAISMQYYYYKVSDDSILNNSAGFKYNNVIIYGSVTDDPDVKEDRLRVIIDVDSLGQAEKIFHYKGTVLASIYRNKFAKEETPPLKSGDVISINARLETLPHRKNPGEFDYGEYLKMHDIEAIANTTGYEKLKVIGGEEGSFYKTKVLIPVKNYINSVIDKNSEGDIREFLRGLLLGDKSNLSKETKDNFINAGVAHIIAVSGLNVAYVLIILNALLLIFPIPRKYKIAIVILGLLFYMNLTGNSPSIVRATIMAITFLLAQLVERKSNSYNNIALAALIIVVMDPRQLFDSGFILSFSAILSIVIFNPLLIAIANRVDWYKALDTERKMNKYFKEGVMLFLGTLAAQIGTIPITAIMFKKVSVVSLVVNLFAIPISNISLALGFVSVIFSLLSAWAASVFAACNNFIMYYLLKSIAISANFDFSFVETYRMDLLFLFAYYAIILILFSINKINYRSRLVYVILLAANFFLFKSILDENRNVKLTYLDVGNSNCTLIEMPEGTNILINAGTSSKTYSSAERNLLPYLKREGVRKIDLLIITAMDANELRNLRYLYNEFDVRRILVPRYYSAVFENEDIRKYFDKKKHIIEFIDSSRVINEKGKFRIYLHYDEKLRGASMMASFVYGNRSFVFSDAEEPTDIKQNEIFMANMVKVTAFRVPSNGSFSFTPAETIVKADPSLVIISSQKDNRKVIEEDVFCQTLIKAGYRVLNVGESGAVILETDGERIKVVKWN